MAAFPLQIIKRAKKLLILRPGPYVLISLALPLLLIVVLFIGVQRSFLVEAETGYLSLRFEGENAWSLPKATLCSPLAIPNRTAEPVAGEACSPFDQKPSGLRNVVIEWREGDTVGLRAERVETGDRVRIIFPPAPAPETGPAPKFAGSDLVIPSEIWADAGALLFSGQATIGRVIGRNERYYLHHADWEARQTVFFGSLLGLSAERVMSGTALRGSELEVTRREATLPGLPPDIVPATVFGHITPADGDGPLAAVSVTMLSEPGRTALRLNNFGLSDPITIRPGFMDLAANSILLLAAFTIITLAASVTQFVGDLRSLGRREDGNDPHGSDS
ncbi:MAG: hypothetical protein AAF618_02670 [Pseudomonadota bacterium]